MFGIEEEFEGLGEGREKEELTGIEVEVGGGGKGREEEEMTSMKVVHRVPAKIVQ